jgi:hypothetical protein
MQVYFSHVSLIALVKNQYIKICIAAFKCRRCIYYSRRSRVHHFPVRDGGQGVQNQISQTPRDAVWRRKKGAIFLRLKGSVRRFFLKFFYL